MPSSIEATRVEQRIVEAAALIPPGGGAVTGWAALSWLGGTWFQGTNAAGEPLPVDLAMWSNIREQQGISLCEERISPDGVTEVDGLPVTIPVRSVAFAMRYAANLRQAVAAFDMAAFNDLVSKDELVAYAGLAPREGLSGWTGMPACRKATSLVDENAWSPQEVGARLVWELDAELPRPLTNVPVFDRAGNHIGTPDLLDPAAGVAVEYNGAMHLEGARRSHDVRREEAFRHVGLECLTVLAGDSSNRPLLAGRMIAARERALWVPEDQRRWTIQPPAWWIPTLTVAQRRALNESQRTRLLRHRAA
ncbi:MAG: hypothetical protein ACRDOX_09910 [Nocardioides sp.]